MSLGLPLFCDAIAVADVADVLDLRNQTKLIICVATPVFVHKIHFATPQKYNNQPTNQASNQPMSELSPVNSEWRRWRQIVLPLFTISSELRTLRYTLFWWSEDNFYDWISGTYDVFFSPSTIATTTMP